MTELSHAQRNYLICRKRERYLIFLSRITIFLLFLTLWEMAAQFGWIDSFIFCSPSILYKTCQTMLVQNELLSHIGITLGETLISFLLVLMAGTGIAILLWLFPKLSKVLEPYLVVLNSLPKSALAPLLIVWLGANVRTIIVAGMSVAVFGSILNLYSGFQQVDPDCCKLIRTLGGNKRDELLKVVLPSSIPLLLSNMKVNIGLCLVGVIIGEFIGARKGLGYLIIYGSQTFKLSWVLLSIVILCLIAMALYSLLSFAQKLYLQHR